jgi:hypothetical protein
MSAQVWTRPWALLLPERQIAYVDDPVRLDPQHRASVWINSFKGIAIKVERNEEGPVQIRSFDPTQEKRLLYQPPLPLHRSSGFSFRLGECSGQIVLEGLPDRPTAVDAKTADEELALRIKKRAEMVWARLHDVDECLHDPLHLWTELSRRWSKKDVSPPEMHVIVRHARRLSRVLDELIRSPRRILRRTQQQIPVARIQEIDRRSMIWLSRQPGETLAERAGDRQRLLAVAREENFDTLENRVLYAYVVLAKNIARDYIDRNQAKHNHLRYRLVFEFRKLCSRIARNLNERGVRVAEAGVMPNFVLQENHRYHQVWEGWKELLMLQRRVDDLWRWQVQSFEEFSALAVMVSLENVEHAQTVATSPIFFRDEQSTGSWVDSDNPLGVFFLPAGDRVTNDLVVEVRYRPKALDGMRQHFAAPIWIRVSDLTDDTKRVDIPVWPIWTVHEGAVDGEVGEIGKALSMLRDWRSRHAIVLRFAADDRSDVERSDGILSVTIGLEGNALWTAVEELRSYFGSVFAAGVER